MQNTAHVSISRIRRLAPVFIIVIIAILAGQLFVTRHEPTTAITPPHVEMMSTGFGNTSQPTSGFESDGSAGGVNIILSAGPTVTEGLARMNINEYHNFSPAYRGQGVRVAVIDQSFGSLQQRIDEGDLPASVVRVECTDETCTTVEDLGTGNNHGVACAEIIHDLAPDATLYLIDREEAPLGVVVAYLIEQNIRLASMSMGWPNFFGPLNGNDSVGVNEAIEAAANAGILFFIAAGNNRESTYVQQFTDENGDNLHEFQKNTFPFYTNYDQIISFSLPENTAIQFFLSWDEWDTSLDEEGNQRVDNPIASTNYDLQVTGPGTISGGSVVQDGDDFPRETVQIQTPPNWHWPVPPKYDVQIIKNNDGPDHELRLWLPQTVTFNEHRTYRSSIAIPADSPHALTVGAVYVKNDEAEYYSSEGPTSDGRLKPDLSSYARVDTASIARWDWWFVDHFKPGFPGTSAATPHVAGAAAVLLSQNPNLTVTELKDLLISYASRNDRGPDGADNRYGAGVLTLPILNDPSIEILSPTAARPLVAGPPDAPSRIAVQVAVRSSEGQFLGGLGTDDFSATVAGTEASISGVIQLADRYVLDLLPPVQPSEGYYPLDVIVRVDGHEAQSRADEAVAYTSATQSPSAAMLILDRSGSMDGIPLYNAQQSAKLFVDLMANGDQIGIGSFSSSARIDMRLATILDEDFDEILSDTVEVDTGLWVAEEPWATTADSYRGSLAWTDSPNGEYANNANVSLTLANQLVIPDTLNQPILSFWHRYDLESQYDFGLVEVSVDNGTTWTEHARFNGNAPNWHQSYVDLSDLAGQGVLLRFRLYSDYTVPRDGWFIDDIAISDGDRFTRDISRDTIDTLSAYGGTSIGGGLQVGFDELSQAAGSTHSQSIVLLSDGEENASPRIDDVLPLLVASRVQVYTVGLGSVDDEALQNIAQQTGGAYYYSPTASELAAIYSAISGQVAQRQTLFDVTGTITETEQIDTEVIVDSSVTEAIFAVSWNDPGRTLRLSLRSPSGTTYEPDGNLPEGVRFTDGQTYQSFNIPDPEPGNWTLEISQRITPAAAHLNADLAAALAADATYNIQVQAVTDTALRVYTDRNTYEQGMPIGLRAMVSSSDPVYGSVMATVEAPDGTTTNLTLTDQGQAGDVLGNDGVFANTFFDTDQVGAYRISVRFDGTQTWQHEIQRLATLSVVVSAGSDADRDGMPTTWEDYTGLESQRYNPLEDPDLDELTNVIEYQLGTHPLHLDSDEDGLSDGEEVNTYNTNPTSWDSDGGGQPDGDEIALGLDPLDPADDIRTRSYGILFLPLVLR
jgi:subtilisin family serine protease